MEEFELEFLKQNYVLDHSRRVFVKEQLSVVKNLMKNELVGQTCFRRLLLGCKGVGKTTLLTSLLKVTKALYPELLTLYVSYAASKKRLAELVCCELRKCCRRPNISDYLEHFKEETQKIIRDQDLDIYDLLLNDQEYFCKLGITSGEARRLVVQADRPPIFERLSTFLEQEGQRLFLVVDEFQDVYSKRFKEVGCPTICDVHAIGDNASGRIHCIISGSSTHLRQLAFAKLPEQLCSQYPNYEDVDLNSTKYQACWIYPFLDVDSFKSLFKRLKTLQNSSYELTEEEETATLYDLFNKTGGLPGYLFQSVMERNVSTYNISAKSVVFYPPDERAKVLLAIYKALPRVADTSNSLAIAASTTFLIPTHISQELLSQAANILYDMSDAGLIRYITSDQGVKMIGFGDPLVFYATAIQGRQTITTYEAAALCSPCGQAMAPLAENVACRLLAHAFKQINKLNHPVTYSDVPLNLCKEGVDAPVSFAHYVMYKELMNGKDTFGADSTVLVPSDEEGKNIAYRIQVKLGSGNIMTHSETEATGKKCHNTAESIANKFTNRVKSAMDAYERSKIPLSSCIHFLATTRDITPDARSHFDSKNIHILDKKYLYEQVWPPEVQELGPPYSKS